jgi:hypothetical protein
LVFLTWWWAGGIPVHRPELAAPIAVVSLWLPLAAIAGFVAWTVRLYRRAATDLRRLERLGDELGSE